MKQENIENTQPPSDTVLSKQYPPIFGKSLVKLGIVVGGMCVVIIGGLWWIRDFQGKSFTYREQQGGCLLYFQPIGEDIVELASDIEYPENVKPDYAPSVLTPGSQVHIPPCTRWGLISLIGITELIVNELNDQRVPEFMILDEQKNPRIVSPDFEMLTGLKTVKRLDLRFCPLLTDNDLVRLKSIDCLRTLYLPTHEGITKDGIAKFRQYRPDVNVAQKNNLGAILPALRE